MSISGLQLCSTNTTLEEKSALQLLPYLSYFDSFNLGSYFFVINSILGFFTGFFVIHFSIKRSNLQLSLVLMLVTKLHSKRLTKRSLTTGSSHHA